MSDKFRPRFVHELLESASRRRPTAVAVRDREITWTYAELLDQSLECAGWLRGQGVGRGDRVVVRSNADVRVLAVLFACARIGAVFVPINEAATDVQWRHFLDDALPTLVIDRVMPNWSGYNPPALEVTVNDPLLLIYTSGSTAAPKAVVSHHSQVLFATLAIAERLRYRADDVVLCRLPLSFDYGLYQALLTTFAGAELVLAGPDSDARLLALIQQHGVTVIPVVPYLAAMLLGLRARDQRSTQVRLVTNTGEELPRTTVEGLRKAFPSAGVQLMFGVTECKRVSIAEVDSDLVRPGALGRPLCGTRVRILDAEGCEAPVGTVGEIVVSGPHVMAGYWRDPGLSAVVFGRDDAADERCLRTGDYGWLDADGYLYFAGRRDQLFKLRGTRVSSLEIEAAACDIPGVTEAAVVPPTDSHDAMLFAVASITPVEVRRELRTRLDVSRTPSICRVVASLPRNSSGKLNRAALHTMLDEEVPG